jgi:hypothetical protein
VGLLHQQGNVASIVIDETTPNYHALVFLAGNGLGGLQEDFIGPDGGQLYPWHQFAVLPQLGTWTHVELTLDLVARTCSATLNGTPVLSASPIDPSWAAGTPSVTIGISFASQSAPWAVRYDNVIVDWR